MANVYILVLSVIMDPWWISNGSLYDPQCIAGGSPVDHCMIPSRFLFISSRSLMDPNPVVYFFLHN